MPLSESLREEPTPDPLVQCPSDVNSLMEKLSVVNGNDVEKNLVTTHDDFSTDGKLIVHELRSLPQNLGPIKICRLQIIQVDLIVYLQEKIWMFAGQFWSQQGIQVNEGVKWNKWKPDGFRKWFG